MRPRLATLMTWHNLSKTCIRVRPFGHQWQNGPPEERPTTKMKSLIRKPKTYHLTSMFALTPNNPLYNTGYGPRERLHKGLGTKNPVVQRHLADPNRVESIKTYTRNPLICPIRSRLHRESNHRRLFCHHANCHQSTPPSRRDSLTAHHEPSTWLYTSLTGH